MSYLHCPTCHRAFNLATDPTCPYCPVAATIVDPSTDIVAAAEQLARALARATPAERTAALSRMDRLALPAPDAAPGQVTLRSIRAALEPPPPPAPPTRPQPLLAQIAMAVLTRIEARPRLRRASQLIRARVRALAA